MKIDMQHLATRNVVALALLAAVGGCAGSPPLGQTGAVAVVSGSELPAPTATDTIGDERPYLIGPFDRLTIGVFGIPELAEREIRADARGRISFPLAGIIEAGGRTPADVEVMIAERLRSNYVRDPQVTVNLKEIVGRTVTVDGQVRQPGVYPVAGQMSLMRAIATARGLDEFAKLEDVVVFRTVDGKKLAALYNLGAVRRGNYPDPEIFPGDVIIVGDSKARRLFKDLLQIVPLLTTPIIVALRN